MPLSQEALHSPDRVAAFRPSSDPPGANRLAAADWFPRRSLEECMQIAEAGDAEP